MPNTAFGGEKGEFERWISNKLRRIRKIPDEIVETVGDQAVEAIRNRIEDPAVETETHTGPRSGRQDTGQMWENTKWWVTSETDDSKRIAVGWQRSDFDNHQPGYAAFQDEGFHHYPDGKWIEGVNALNDVSHEMRLLVQRQIRDKLRDRGDNA
jgi:hypothetical protein